MSIILDGLTLPSGIKVEDEFGWSPISQHFERSVTGANLFDSGVKLHGKPLVLNSDDESGWITRADLKLLYAKLSNDSTFNVTFEDLTIQACRFDHGTEGKPISATPLIQYNELQNSDMYINLTIKLIEV